VILETVVAALRDTMLQTVENVDASAGG